MNDELKNRTREWMELERKTLEQRKKAESFYEEKLLELIAEDYLERNGDLVFEEVRYLIVSVGTSYEPVVLNIRLLNPERVLFLYTEKSAATLNKIVRICKLQPDEYDKAKVNEVNPLDIYREIRRAYLAWQAPEKLYIDFTGGTKAMSAAAALAGAMINVQLIYVGSNDYLPDFRKPSPGSEELVYIENPLAVFGDLEIQKALELFEKYNFGGAAKKLESLKETLPDPEMRTQLSFAYRLARAYEAWDALDFLPAFDSMKQLNRELDRDRIHRTYLLMDRRQILGAQEGLLELLSRIPGLIAERKQLLILRDSAMIHALMFTMYQNALTRERQKKYDMATLLFYRLLEMIEQRRLSRYDLYVSSMDYLNMRPDLKQTPEYKDRKPREVLTILRDRVIEIRTALFQRNISDFLSEQVSLLDGFVILMALRDPILGRDDRDGIRLLRQIRSRVYLRNNSIFAHGLGPVQEEEYRKFSGFVTELLKAYCLLEQLDFEEYRRNTEWVIPGMEAPGESR